MAKKLIDGINEDISNQDYHADNRYLSSSNLKLVLKDREKFYNEIILGNRESISKPAFDEGSYAHTLILEPHLEEKEYAFFPGWTKRGNEWEAFKEANSTKIILSKPQKVRVQKLIKAYNKRPEAVELIGGGFSEHTVAGELMGVPIKVRADYINVDKGYVADVKTTGYSADVDTFKYTVQSFSYQLSAALYAEMFKKYYGKDFDFYFIVLSKKDSTCEVFKASEATMIEGRNMMTDALNIYKKCLDSGDWTNYNKHEVSVDSSDYEILEV